MMMNYVSKKVESS